MKAYWEKSITFDEYMKVAKERVSHPRNKADEEMKEYYDLGLQRMERTLKTFRKEEEQLEILKKKNFKGKIVVVKNGHF